MSNIVVLQARISSSRLPAKVLLPINDLPMIVLATKRAGNRGRDILVAISDTESDDVLASVLSAHGIRFFRGSLKDTLSRFIKALASYDEQTIVFRLTGDNIFPDGLLLDEVESDFTERNLKYLCTSGEKTGLPYGTSVEVMRLATLRQANIESTNNFDKEHVTPHIIRTFGKEQFLKYSHLEKGNLRCTVDTCDDYINICNVFSTVQDPINEPFLNLIDKLGELKNSAVSKRALTDFVVGSCQLGLDYGISNNTGKPKFDVSEKLIKKAIENGVSYIDTASAYEESEAVIGRSLSGGWDSRVNIVTKLAPLSGTLDESCSGEACAKAEASVYKSCLSLGINKLDVLLVHRVEDIFNWNRDVWNTLLQLKNNGYIDKLGASVQSRYELLKIINLPDVSHIQLPFNILDYRWSDCSKEIYKTKSSKSLIIHARSAFLQGLLLSDNKQHWSKANCDDPQEILTWLSSTAKSLKRVSIKDLCLSYVRSQPWVDAVVVGMETEEQLMSNIDLFSMPKMSSDDITFVNNSRPVVSPNLLNPASWKV